MSHHSRFEGQETLDAFDRVAPTLTKAIALLNSIGYRSFNAHMMPVIEIHDLSKKAELISLLNEFQSDRAPVFSVEDGISESGEPILILVNPLYKKMQAGDRLVSKAGEVDATDLAEVEVLQALKDLTDFLLGKADLLGVETRGIHSDLEHFMN